MVSAELINVAQENVVQNKEQMMWNNIKKMFSDTKAESCSTDSHDCCSSTPKEEEPSGVESSCSTVSSSEGSSCSTNPNSNGHDCCTPQPKGKVECPKCGEKVKGVLGKTLEHLLTDVAKSKLDCFDGFYFCTSPSCEVVYFRDETLLTQKDISVVVGHKDGASPATVCYCFEWSKEKIKAELQEKKESTATEDIKHKMDTVGCSCEILNPSGGCCLGDVGKTVKAIKKDLGL